MKSQDCIRTHFTKLALLGQQNAHKLEASLYFNLQRFPSGSSSTPGFPCPTHDRRKPAPSDRRTKNTEAPTFENPISLRRENTEFTDELIWGRSIYNGRQLVFFTWNPRVIPAFPLWFNSFDSELTLAYKDYIVKLLYKRRQNHRKQHSKSTHLVHGTFS